jgi:hypothetical protein
MLVGTHGATVLTRVLVCLQMPYEDVLPYKDFALRISQHAIYLLPSILEFVMAEPGRVSPFPHKWWNPSLASRHSQVTQ